MNRERDHEKPSEWIDAAVEAHQTALRHYVARLLGDTHRAHDVVQDVFVRLLAQPHDAVAGHLAEWLYTTARNRAIDVLRKEGRMKALEDGQAEAVVASEPTPGRALEQAEARALLLRLLDRLPPAQQEVVRLKFQSGFSYKEIAGITHRSVNHVGVILHEAMKRLRAEAALQRS